MSREPFSLAVLVARIPADGKHFRVETERAAAPRHRRRARASSRSRELTADLDVRPVGAEAFAVTGTLSAAVVQTDVVTLEPVRQEVREAIDLTLLPAEEGAPTERAAQPQLGLRRPTTATYTRVGASTSAPSSSSIWRSGSTPIRARRACEFPGHVEGGPEPETSPFAALATLKRDRE